MSLMTGGELSPELSAVLGLDVEGLSPIKTTFDDSGYANGGAHEEEKAPLGPNGSQSAEEGLMRTPSWGADGLGGAAGGGASAQSVRPPLSKAPKHIRDARSATAFIAALALCLTVALLHSSGNGEVTSLLMMSALLVTLGLAGCIALFFTYALEFPVMLERVFLATTLAKLGFGLFLVWACESSPISVLLCVLLWLSAVGGEVTRRRVRDNTSFAAVLLQTLPECLDPRDRPGVVLTNAPARRRALRHVTFILMLLYLAQMCYLIGWAAMAGRAIDDPSRFWLVIVLVVLLYWPVSVLQTMAYGIASATMLRFLHAAGEAASPKGAAPPLPSPGASPSASGRRGRKSTSGLLVTVQTLAGPNFGSVCRSALMGPLSSHVAGPLLSLMRALAPETRPMSMSRKSCRNQLRGAQNVVIDGLRALEDSAPRFALVYVAVYGLAFGPACEAVRKRQVRLRLTSKCGEAALYVMQTLCQLFMLTVGFVFLVLTLPHLHKMEDIASTEEYVLAGFGIAAAVLFWVEGFWKGLLDGLLVHFSYKPEDVAAVMPSVYPRLRRLSSQDAEFTDFF
uniref:Uncharacterized protein n=1 Tax=Phaeomonas parva TaxID=124430 RepID=A0A6U4IN43_9STRA|mmetsp:Transcript_38696/g.121233  ORF Transcript_38696/g.121233 Transcript_38696/m.121233 type:complete len:567 (+) Transcript_38696:122-1822(+)